MAKQSDIILRTSTIYVSARNAERLRGILRVLMVFAVAFLMGIDLNQLLG